MVGKLITSSFGTAALLALVAGGAAFAAQGDCAGFTWPNYPPDCLARDDGEATKLEVRTAIANPPAAAPDVAPLPVINARPTLNPRVGPADRMDEPHENFDRLQEPPPGGPTATITVWRGTTPTTYIVRRG
jgi:hypothetical protein